MRRRSLFAGLAGLLAAPKVVAAMPASGGYPTHWIELVGETCEFDLVSGSVVSPGETVKLNTSWHAAQRMHDKVEWKLPNGVVAHDVHIVGSGGQSSGGIVEMAPGQEMVIEVAAPTPGAAGPIAVTWSGYADELSAAPSPPEASALAGGGEGKAALPPPAALSSGSFHAAQPGRAAAPLASESHPEK